MILIYCIKCEFHERVQIDSTLSSKCCKESCLSIYSNCFRVAAIKKFISENNLHSIKDRLSALDICYPLF